jgi:hypothetical protein
MNLLHLNILLNIKCGQSSPKKWKQNFKTLFSTALFTLKFHPRLVFFHYETEMQVKNN